MNSTYFLVEIWSRKKMIYRVQVGDPDKLISGMSDLHEKGLLKSGPGELIVKHNYVSDSKKGRTIFRLPLAYKSMLVDNVGDMSSIDYAARVFRRFKD